MTAPDPYGDELRSADDECASLVRRLRSLTGPVWRSRRVGVLGAVAALTEVAARAEGGEPHALPAIDDHAIGDAVAVIAGDVLEALEAHRDDGLLEELREALRNLRRAAG